MSLLAVTAGCSHLSEPVGIFLPTAPHLQSQQQSYTLHLSCLFVTGHPSESSWKNASRDQTEPTSIIQGFLKFHWRATLISSSKSLLPFNMAYRNHELGNRHLWGTILWTAKNSVMINGMGFGDRQQRYIICIPKAATQYM